MDLSHPHGAVTLSQTAGSPSCVLRRGASRQAQDEVFLDASTNRPHPLSLRASRARRRAHDRFAALLEDCTAQRQVCMKETREGRAMCADRSKHPIVHLVGSLPLPDAETVFRTVSGALGGHLVRLPDGETGIRKTWIRFLQDVLADNPAIEVAEDVPPFKFVQWDGKVVREIPRLRLKPGAAPDPATFHTGYADMAIDSWAVFDRLQRAGVIPEAVKFQVSLPTPIAPVYNNMVPADRPA